MTAKTRLLSLVALLVVLTIGVSSCQMTAGPFGARDGLVACMTAIIDADQSDLNALRAAGGVGVYHDSCNGDPVNATGSLRVRLWHSRRIGDIDVNYLCKDSGEITSVASPPWTWVLYGRSGCPDIHPGDRFFAEVKATAYISGWPYESDWIKSPKETWVP